MTNKMKSKEIIVEVTEEEYQADLDNGLHEDEVLKPGTHTFKRGGFLARHNMSEQTSSSAKVRISINLDDADPRFIDAIAERVHARRSATRKRSGRASAQQTAQT